MSKSTTEIMAGIVRSIKKATLRHNAGIITDFEYIRAANEAISRMDACQKLTPVEEASYTRSRNIDEPENFGQDHHNIQPRVNY